MHRLLTQQLQTQRLLTRRFLTLLLALTATLLLAQSASALSGHLTLLTVTEGQTLAEQTGGTADLYLEIQPGTGQIFLDTYPLAKLDTQSSTRYATRIACEYADADCEHFDFFYTIRANSRLVGGPSAGAAIAVLAAALLTGQEVDETVTITGTIDSGGLVGPVAGVKAKALAAADAGLSTVLISEFASPSEVNESYLDYVETANITANLSRVYIPVNTSALPITVHTVTNIAEALAYFTGVEPERTRVQVEEDDDYRRIMQAVAEELCDRRRELATNETDPLGLADAREAAAGAEDWYSLASYCFRDAIAYRERSFEELSPGLLEQHRNALGEAVLQFKQQLKQRTPRTIAQLETYMIVSERLDETLERLGRNLTAINLAFAHERLNSAQVWYSFWSMESPSITLDEHHLRRVCNAKLTEAQERISYVELYLPDEYLENANDEILQARSAIDEEKPTLCIYHAAKARAQADILSTTLATPEEQFPVMLSAKLGAVAQVIDNQEHFPILGYSYYRYSQSLAEHDHYSALTFAEYALELADLAMYFPKGNGVRLPRGMLGPLLLFIGGTLTGIAVALWWSRRRSRQNEQRSKHSNKQRRKQSNKRSDKQSDKRHARRKV